MRSRPERRWSRKAALLVLCATVLVAGEITFAVIVGSWMRGEFAPWLAGLSSWGRAGTGLAVGAAATLPALLLRPGRAPLLMEWALWVYLGLMWILLMFLWMPPKAGVSNGLDALYREQAGWFIPASVGAYHLLGWVLLRCRSEPVEPAAPESTHAEGEQ